MHKLLAAVLSLAILTTSARAQDNTVSPPSVSSEVKGKFQPAYTVTPIVNKFVARRGQRISFSFEIVSHREGVVATVRPVALKQRLNGIIVPDAEAEPPTALKLSGSQRLELTKDEPLTISGEIRVPTNQSPFHSFGILIRDEGKRPLKSQPATQQFGFNFVTQYILRCDIDVQNGRNEDLRNLKIQSADFVEFQGIPMARVRVENPTDSTIEFSAESRLSTELLGRTNTWVALSSPSRANFAETERNTMRIMPHSVVDMQAQWPRAVFEGDYNLETRLTLKRRVYKTLTTKLHVGAQQFRGQETWVRRVTKGIHVSPSQIAVGHNKPFKRMQPVTLFNHAKEAANVRFTVVDRDGGELKWAIVRPAEFKISASGERMAMVSLGRMDDRKSHRTGFLSIVATNSEGESIGEQKLPLSFFGENDLTPDLSLEQLQAAHATDRSGNPTIRLTLVAKNNSTFPVPLLAVMHLKDIANNSVELHDGFGKWLLAGESRKLIFDLSESESEFGDLNGHVELLNTENRPIFRQQFEIAKQAASP